MEVARGLNSTSLSISLKRGVQKISHMFYFSMIYDLFPSLVPAKPLQPKIYQHKGEFPSERKPKEKAMPIYSRARGSALVLDGPVATLLFLGAET